MMNSPQNTQVNTVNNVYFESFYAINSNMFIMSVLQFQFLCLKLCVQSSPLLIICCRPTLFYFQILNTLHFKKAYPLLTSTRVESHLWYKMFILSYFYLRIVHFWHFINCSTSTFYLKNAIQYQFQVLFKSVKLCIAQ